MAWERLRSAVVRKGKQWTHSLGLLDGGKLDDSDALAPAGLEQDLGVQNVALR